jgi:hypothetical protein
MNFILLNRAKQGKRHSVFTATLQKHTPKSFCHGFPSATVNLNSDATLIALSEDRGLQLKRISSIYSHLQEELLRSSFLSQNRR